MNYEKISDYGELGIDFKDINGAGALVTKDFLSKMLKRIVERSVEYHDEVVECYDVVDDYPFAYRERQLHSVVCPSIADITHSFLIENPLKRKPANEEEYRGAVDYWVLYRNFSFFIELKHTFFAYSKANNPRKTIHKKLTRALDQLKSIKKDECKQQTIGDGMRKIALQVIVFYRGSKDENRLINDLERRDFKLLFEKLLVNSGLKKKSNMRALWVLDKRFGKPIEFAKTYEVYPAVGFIGNVSKIIR